MPSLVERQNLAIFGGNYSGQDAYFNFEELLTVLGDVDRGQTVLDIGCGNGAIASQLARYFGVEVTGIDLEPELIRIARQNAFLVGVERSTSFYVLDMDDVSASMIARCNMVISLDALQYSKNLDSLVRIISANLHGGSFVGTIWCTGDVELSRAWGMPRLCEFGATAALFTHLFPEIRFIPHRGFEGRLNAYKRFLAENAVELTAMMGKVAYETRCDLIARSAQAANRKEFIQAVFTQSRSESGFA